MMSLPSLGSSEGGRWAQSVNKDVAFGSASAKLIEALHGHTKEYIDRHLRNEQARQILFGIVGDEFRERNYPNEDHNPYLLLPPYMLPDMRQALEQEYTYKLESFVVSKANKTDMLNSELFMDFQDSMKLHYDRSLSARRRDLNARYLQQALRTQGSESQLNSSSTFLAEAIASVVPSSQNLGGVITKLRGRCTPMPLRSIFWRLLLYVEEDAQRFEKDMHHKMAAEQVGKHSEAVTQGLVHKLVYETMQNVWPLCSCALYGAEHASSYSEPVIARRAEEVLNRNYVSSRSYCTFHGPLLIPLLLVFPDLASNGGALGSMFAKLLGIVSTTFLRSAVPLKTPATEAAIGGRLLQGATAVLHMIKSQDPELYEHLLHVVIMPDQGQNASWGDMLQPILQCALVGYLPMESVMFVWDQCFYQLLEPVNAEEAEERTDKPWTFLSFVAAYIRLLREALLFSFGPLEVQEVLHSKGRSICTRDLRLLTARGELRAVPVDE